MYLKPCFVPKVYCQPAYDKHCVTLGLQQHGFSPNIGHSSLPPHLQLQLGHTMDSTTYIYILLVPIQMINLLLLRIDVFNTIMRGRNLKFPQSMPLSLSKIFVHYIDAKLLLPASIQAKENQN
jgi:hypothetical protein